MEEKIINFLTKLYNTNFFVGTLISLLLTLIMFIITETMIIGYLINNNYLIVNTVENLRIKTPPYTQQEVILLLNSINNEMRPLFILYYLFIFLTLLCLIIGTYKLIRRKLNHV